MTKHTNWSKVYDPKKIVYENKLKKKLYKILAKEWFIENQSIKFKVIQVQSNYIQRRKSSRRHHKIRWVVK